MNIGVYKSDVDNRKTAGLIMKAIEKKMGNHDMSFDLEDRDKVFRIVSMNGAVDEPALRYIFEKHGHSIEPLP